MSTALEIIRNAPAPVLSSVAHDVVDANGLVDSSRDRTPTLRDFFVTVDPGDKVHIRFSAVEPPFGFNFSPTVKKMCVGLGPAAVEAFAKAVESAMAPPATVDHVLEKL